MHPPSGITKKSAFFATVGTGDFTVADDKECLGRVVEALVEVRKAFALKVRDLFMYRVCCCAKARQVFWPSGCHCEALLLATDSWSCYAITLTC